MRRLGILLLALAGCGRSPETLTPQRPAPETRAAAPVRPPEDPEARKAREAQIRQDVHAIQSECERAAGGDWQKWEQQTARYRDALKRRLVPRTTANVADNELLVGHGMPIHQLRAPQHLAHVVDPASWDAFRKTRDVVAASRWLRERGIDLIFLSVPLMPEVYIEQFLDETPTDGVIAPHLRRTFLELSESDVEVVNTYRIMRDARPGGFLFLPVDIHWNQLGVLGPARDVAKRLSRYTFGREAKKAAPVTKSTTVPQELPPTVPGTTWRLFDSAILHDEDWKAVLGAMPPTKDYITSPDGSLIYDDLSSPVLLIGNSFVKDFRDVMIREANLRIRTLWVDASTTEAFAGFLRQPEQLAGVRVVVWVTSDGYLARFRPVPPPIREALQRGE
jgi:hypothetical protein